MVARSHAARLAAATISGIAFVAAFPPFNQAWAAPLSVALLLWAVHGASARITVFVSALHAIVGFGLLVHWVSVVATVALPALLAVIVFWRIALGLVLRLCVDRKYAALTIPAAWLLCEWIQCHVPWGGFPWGCLSYIGGVDWLTRNAVWVGGNGLSALVVAAGVAIWQMGQRLRTGGRMLAVVSAFAVCGALAAPLVAPRVVPNSALRAAVIQGGVPRLGFATVEQERAVFARHVAATQAIVKSRQKIDLIVWPENSIGDAVISDPVLMQQLSGLVRSAHAALLSGTVLLDSGNPSQLRNRSMFWGADGSVTQTYDKRHLVPFGEFVPLRSLARKLTAEVDLVGRDFTPGTRPGVMSLSPRVTFGILMCFEVGYGELARDLGNVGFLVNQTNNATYLGSGQPAQQYRMSQVRAAQTGRTTLVSATSGVSGVIDGYGQTVPGTRVDANTHHVSVVTVHARTGQTPAATLEPVSTLASLLLTCGVISPWWPRRRERGPTVDNLGALGERS